MRNDVNFVSCTNAKSSSNAVNTLLTLIAKIYSIHITLQYSSINFDSFSTTISRALGTNPKSGNFARAISRHSSSFECNTRVKLLSDPNETIGNCNHTTYTSYLHIHTDIRRLLLSFFRLILLPNNTNYWMKHPFYYATYISREQNPTDRECRDWISYQASHGSR